MPRQIYSQWSAYDFSPVEARPKSRKRLQSTIPPSNSLEIRNSYDPTLQRPAQAVETVSIDSGEETDHQDMQQRPGRQRRTLHEDDPTMPSSPEQNRARSASRAPGIGDILGSFKLPEARRTFKEEPVDEDIMRLPLRRASPGRGKTSRRQTRGSSRAADASTEPAKEREAKPDEVGTTNREDLRHRPDRPLSNNVVDLTEEQGNTHQNGGHITSFASQLQRPGPSLTHTASPSSFGDVNDIPTVTLQQIRDHYQRENVDLPDDVKTWSQLRNFTERYQQWQRSVRNPSSQRGHYHMDTNVPMPGFPFPTNQNFTNQPASEDLRTIWQPQKSLNNANRSSKTNNSSIGPLIKLEPGDPQRERWSNPRYAGFGTASNPLPNSVAENIWQSIQPTKVSQQNSTRRPNQDTTAFIETAAGRALMRWSDALSEILPVTSPTGHPHLVALWDDKLLRNVPTTQHNHLDLVDTVVSTMAKYDMKGQTAIKAFLDIKDVPHFFFLFKSKTSRWHSWSIEREWDIVTIGLERNHRATNTAESERPSSGQFDVTIQYKIAQNVEEPAISSHKETDSNSNSDITSNTGTNTAMTTSATDTGSTTTTEEAQTSTISETPLDPASTTNTSTLPQDTTKAKTQPNRGPGKWNLHATTIFPSSPNLETFLWSTPPNRGADEIMYYQHPSQTSILPVSHLSMLARYLQHTAFTCTAIEAEFQVAWGRRVRYDAQLGRVRATWDYAMKSARTQAEKRKRGDYNRVVGGATSKTGGSDHTGNSNVGVDDGNATPKKKTGASGGSGGKEDRPGAGESLGWLAGRNGARNIHRIRTEARQDTGLVGKDQTTNGATMAIEHGTTTTTDNNATTEATEDTNGPTRKRVKREERKGRAHNDGDLSGSEYEASSSDEDTKDL